MDTEIRKIQLKCMEILDIVHRICVEHHIQYSLCGGSVVGAHLYKGFLPWDDDIDIMMTRENYNRFVSIVPSVLPEGFSMLNFEVSDDFVMGLTKIINNNTTYVHDNGQVSGVFVDVTVYDKVPTNFLRHVDMFLVKRSFTVLRGKMPGKGLKNIIRNLFIDVCLPEKRKYFLFFSKVAQFLGHTSHYTYSELFGGWAQTISYRPSDRKSVV